MGSRLVSSDPRRATQDYRLAILHLLPLGVRLRLPALTADRPWLKVPSEQGIEINLIR